MSNSDASVNTGGTSRRSNEAMAETRVYTQWPDGTEVCCSAPSALIEQYLVVGRSYSISGFLDRVGEALTSSAERLSELEALRAKGATFGGGMVFVAAFD